MHFALQSCLPFHHISRIREMAGLEPARALYSTVPISIYCYQHLNQFGQCECCPRDTSQTETYDTVSPIDHKFGEGGSRNHTGLAALLPVFLIAIAATWTMSSPCLSIQVVGVQSLHIYKHCSLTQLVVNLLYNKHSVELANFYFQNFS